MKHGIKRLIDVLEHLDPATDSRVQMLSVLLSNGATILTKDVTVESDGMVYARDARASDRLHYFHRDEVTAVSVQLAPDQELTFPELLADAAKR